MTREQKFSLRPGLGWFGYLKVIGWDGANPVVQFTAQVRKNPTRWIYDHTPLTPKQFKDWTGAEPPEQP